MSATRTRLLFVLLSALAGATPALAAGPLAVVAAVRGRVEVASARGGAAVPATFGRALERGDRVTVGRGGSATLFFGDGGVVTLPERGSMTVGGAAPAAGGALPGEVFTEVSRFATAGSRETGLVSMAGVRAEADAGAPLLLSPRNTTVLEAAPTLRWRAFPGAVRYRVRLGPAAGGESWSRELAATPGAEPSLAFPDDAPRLEPGVDYEWEVEAIGAQGTLRAESAVVRTLPAEAAAGVRANLARIAESAGGEGTAAARFLAGSYLAGLKLHDEAARQFVALVELAPDSPEAHEALGSLYLETGLADRAAAEFQRALALHRGAR